MTKLKVSYELDINESKEYIEYEIRKKCNGRIKNLSVTEIPTYNNEIK